MTIHFLNLNRLLGNKTNKRNTIYVHIERQAYFVHPSGTDWNYRFGSKRENVLDLSRKTDHHQEIL